MARGPYAGPKSDLRPDTDAMWQFLSWWFRECNRGVIELGWMNPRTGGLTEFRRFETEDESVLKFAEAVNSVPGQSIYVRAATIDPAAPDGHTEDINVCQVPGTWADLDTPEDIEKAKTVTGMIRPNARIVTGRHPHLRYQIFIRTTEPIVSVDMSRAINLRMIKLYGGDSSVSNPSRLMRLPGTIAYPWKKGREIPELTTFEMAPDDRPKSYPISTLASLLPKETDTPKQDAPSKIAPGIATSTNLIRSIRAGEQWHNNMVRLVAHWIGRGWTTHEILAASESFTLPGYTHAQTIAEVTKAIDGGRKKWGVPDNDHAVSDGPSGPFPEKITDPWDSLTPPEFPLHVLPPVLRDFVESRARIIGADPCGLAWSALSACSAALDGRTRLKMKRHDSWSVPPPIWVCLVGSSSTKKTPIFQASWGPLEEVQARALRGYADQMAHWKAQPKEARGDEPPKPRRLVSHDATMESVQEILSRQERGLGLLRDELAGFIGAMEKYSGNGKGAAADRAFFLQSYNGGQHVVDRVARGTGIAIHNLLLTICGGIQPDRLAQFPDLSDDGLWQRFVPIIVRQGDLGQDAPEGPEVEAYKLRLESLIDVSSGALASLSEGAHAVRERLEREMFDMERAAPISSKFASFVGKMPGLFGRLCLVLSYLDASGLGYVVSEKTADAARILITRCVIPHAAQVYLTMGGEDGGIEITRSIAGYILAKKLNRILVSDLTSNVRQCRNRSVADVVQQISRLVAAGWLNPESEMPNNKVWIVNPTVHTAFANRAGVERVRREATRDLITGGEVE